MTFIEWYIEKCIEFQMYERVLIPSQYYAQALEAHKRMNHSLKQMPMNSSLSNCITFQNPINGFSERERDFAIPIFINLLESEPDFMDELKDI